MNPGEFRAQASLFALQCSGTSFLRAAVRAVRATRDVHRDMCCLPFRLPFCSPFVVWWCIAGGGAGTRPCPHQDHRGGCLHAGDASNEAHQHADYPGEKTLNACVCVCMRVCACVSGARRGAGCVYVHLVPLLYCPWVLLLFCVRPSRRNSEPHVLPVRTSASFFACIAGSAAAGRDDHRQDGRGAGHAYRRG